MSNFEYISCVRFLLQLLICESVFVLGFKRRKFFWLRLVGSIGMCFLGGWIFIALVKLIPESSAYWRIPYYFWLFGLSMLGIFLTFDVKLTSVLFAGTGGYATQHMGYLLRYMISRYITGDFTSKLWFEWIMNIVPYAAAAAAIFFVFLYRNFRTDLVETKSLRHVLLALVAMIVTIVLSVFSTRAGRDDAIFSLREVYDLGALVTCVLVLIIQNSFNKQNKLAQENIMIERLLYEKKEQQLVSKDNLEMINIKFHDIKHQLNALKLMDNDEKRKAYIEDIEEAMLVHDTIVQTGNEALDIIINEKSLFCERNNIKFTYLINGEHLNFMKVTDLYALFSNAMSNAIESELKEADKDKRIISLNARAENGFVYITIENYCSNMPKFEDGLPVTTKDDTLVHGYGTKSIKLIVKKYGGHIRMDVQKDMFVLEMLFNQRD